MLMLLLLLLWLSRLSVQLLLSSHGLYVVYVVHMFMSDVNKA
ncbi:hypothetical protein LOK49_LG10G01085 [Camellia lanceoleosa]|uniref:Uncharacterized protein n=1 Tax=Camellia lanceoleosa TaxID=1840588 RepID=A0ACC0G838_9ERIC|nr:hypothetical protein LOK49_LG10G01085 [Camellia lanceoleosa]